MLIKMLKGISISMIFLISFHTSAQAQLPKTTSWYVSNSGNDSNIGDKSNPLRFISTAIGKVQTGDSIIVMPGTYSENLNFNDKVFILISSSGADSTLLTSSISDNTIRVGNVSTPDTVSYLREITGFTITNRLANAVYTEGNTKLRFRNCIFKNNVGAIHNNAVTTFENCLFLNNDWAVCLQESNSGRDLANFSGDEVFFNCIFYHNGTINTCSSLGGWKPKFINSILIENSRFGSTYSNTNLGPGYEVYNSIIDDSLYSGINSNLNINPGFINVNGNDFRLTKSSPALGNGVNEVIINGKTYKAPLFDFVGITRPNPAGSKPDIGAYESLLAAAKPELNLIQKVVDTTLITWDYYDKSKVARVLLYRDTSRVIDTLKAIKIYILFKPTDINLKDTLPGNSSRKYYYQIKLQLKDSSYSDLSNVQSASGIMKTPSFLPPMVDAKYAWGDIDGDGDMDLAVIGNANEIFFQIYKNNNGTFETVLDRTKVTQIYKGTLKFADIDNDGDIDLFVSGQRSTNTTNIGAYLFKNDGSGNFASTELTTLIATREGDAAFGDYDNDGDLDLTLSGLDVNGKSRLCLYQNNALGQFAKVSNFIIAEDGATGLSYADLAWVDYDNDGDQDLIYTGLDIGGILRNTLINETSIDVTRGDIPTNQFIVSYFKTKDANFDLADLDQDGKVDMVISGAIGTKIIYNINFKSIDNILGVLIKSDNFIDSVSGKVKLADYDNDGDIDILFAGVDQLAKPRTIFYINSGDGRNFTKKTYDIIPNLDMAGFSLADFDNDKDLDLVISGQKSGAQGGNVISEIYSFEPENKNVPPAQPKNVALQDFGDGRVLVKWDPATDDLNPTGTLNYLVKIGSISLGGNVGKPFTVVESNKNGGNLLNPEAVLVYSNKYFTQLDPGKYYMLVQAVDNNKLTSIFSDTLFLNLTYPWKIVNQGGIVDGTIPGNVNYSSKWGDIDLDNDYDFIYGNSLYESNKLSYKPSLYQNDANSLLSQMINPYIKWNDLNQDGILDMIFSSTEVITPLNSSSQTFNLNIFLNDTATTAIDPITKQILSKGKLTKAVISPQDSIHLGNTKFKISDLNNDGKPDILFAGLNSNSESRIYIFSTGPAPNDTTNFIGFRLNPLKTNLDSILLQQQSANLLFDFGDIDGDRDNDFVAIYKNASGKSIAKVYLNSGLDTTSGKIIFTENVKYVFEPLENATLDLIDFDKDGDLDLVTSGRSFTLGKQFVVYESKNNSFVPIQSNIGAFENGKVSFGDLNNDGYADIIYSGTREGVGFIAKVALFDPLNRVYNEQSQFYFGDYQNLSVEFGDFDGDSDLDILLNGRERVSGKDVFRVYKNVQNESSLVQKAIALAGGKANMLKTNQVVIASAMNHIFEVNVAGTKNQDLAEYDLNAPPSIPQNTKEKTLRKVQRKYRVAFNWDSATDENTPSDGLTYELRVGTKPGASDVVISSSNKNGFKLIPEEGNVGRNKAWEIDLPSGKYYWSVQAIDASLSGSAFSAERQFEISSTLGLCSSEVLVKPKITTDQAELVSSSLVGNQWYFEGNAIPGANATTYKPVASGNYTLKIIQDNCASVVSEPYYYIITAVIELGNGQFIKVYPNPISESGEVNIQRKLNNLAEEIDVQVFDMAGRLVTRKTLKSAETKIRIPGVSGNYILKMTWGENNFKFFKIYKR